MEMFQVKRDGKLRRTIVNILRSNKDERKYLKGLTDVERQIYQFKERKEGTE